MVLASGTEGPGRFTPVADQIAAQLEAALVAADQGKPGEARTAVYNAYFDVFEASGLEARVAMVDSDLTVRIESQFGLLRERLGRGENGAEVRAAAAQLTQDVRQAATKASQEGSAWGGFISAFLILLREGFEALLIVGGMVAFLTRAGRKQDVRLVGLAVLSGLALSLVLAVGLGMLATGAGLAREVLEGTTLLVASVVLFYVSHWLVSRAESARWNSYIKERLKAATGERGSAYAIFATAFLAVFREGAETVLFIAAIAGDSPGGGKVAVAGGVVAGSVVIGVLYWTFKKGLVKLPMGPYFAVTGAMLYGLAVVFAGKGVTELQAAGWISVTPLAWMPAVPALGIAPTLESTVAQFVLLFAVLASLAWVTGRRAPVEQPARQP